jgi:four helix bundle protein
MSSSFSDLRVWHDAMRLSVETYRVTASFPKHEVYGVTQQMRRAAVSVPSNIAEGKGRHSNREFAQFLFHARGSLLELETQIMIAQELQYLPVQEGQKLQENATKVGRSLTGLINSVRTTVGPKPTTNDQRPTTKHV